MSHLSPLPGSLLKLALVDDHPVFLEGLRAVLHRQRGFSIAGVGFTADEAVALAQQVRPDVMLIDLSIPGSGLKAVGDIAERFGNVRTIVLTGSDNFGDATAALDAGASGFIHKGTEPEELVSAIRSICRGEIYVTPRILAKIVRHRPVHPLGRNLDQLTSREEMIVRLVARGLTNREISAELGLAIVTVRNHVVRIMSKLNARNRVQACVVAAELLPDLVAVFRGSLSR